MKNPCDSDIVRPWLSFDFRSIAAAAAVLCACVVLGPVMATAQEVGHVVATEGRAEIVRGQAVTALRAGATVQKGDELRTGRPGRVRILFADQTVLTISEDSTVTINEQIFDPERQQARGAVGLVRGKLSSLVSAYYNWSGSSYEVKTPTAVAGVRGTEFTVTYDEVAETTEVLGFHGAVRVRSIAAPDSPGVLVTASEVSRVVRGGEPTAPERVEDRRFRQEIEGLDFFGGGVSYPVTLPDSLRSGASVPEPDRAPGVVAAVPVRPEHLDVSTLVGKSPLVFGGTTGQVGVIIDFPR